MPCVSSEHLRLDRRAFLVAGGLSFCGLHVPSVLSAAEKFPEGKSSAKSTIFIWLSGGPSHIDLWDMKPDAPKEYRGEFNPVATSAPDIQLCEHLPHLARQAHHLAIVRSVGQIGTQNDHHAGYYYNLTGHAHEAGFVNGRPPRPDDWPFIGSVIAARRPPHPNLPQLVTLPDHAGNPDGRRAGQYAARLGVQYDPMYVFANHESPFDFQAPSLSLCGDMTASRLKSRRGLLEELDRAQGRLDYSRRIANFSTLQEKAFSLLTGAQSKAAFDLTNEPESVRERYGSGLTGASLLCARRLVEVGVPFVTVFAQYDHEVDKKFGCKGGAWDTHWNNFSCLKDYLVPDFDRPFATLLDDLHERGLLDQTLVVVTSEMGRKPKIGDPRSRNSRQSGRDHWTPCMSILMAGGGIRGGQTYGSSDRFGAYPEENPLTPADIAKTIYAAMGVHDLEARDFGGQPFNLLEEGEALSALF